MPKPRETDRIVTFIHQPDDFLNSSIAQVEEKMLRDYQPTALNYDLKYEFLPARDVIAAVDSKNGPALFHNGINLLDRRRSFIVEHASSNPQADRYLRAIYECISASDSILLNRTTKTRDFIERDKIAIVNYAAALKIPHIKSLVVPFGKYAKTAMQYLELLETESWILKPREMSMGRGVLKLESREALESALELVGQSQNSYIIQPYYENVGDMRVYCVDGKIVTSLMRRAKDGGYVANIARSGEASVGEISPQIADWCKRITDSLGADYLCVDWLMTKNGPVLNEWCTTLGAFRYLPEPERSKMTNAFFKFISGRFEAPYDPSRGNQRCLPEEFKKSASSSRVLTHIYESPEEVPKKIEENVVGDSNHFVDLAAEKVNVDIRLILGREVVPVATFPSRLMYKGEDLLENDTCFIVGRVSSDPATSRHLQSIYETVLQSTAPLLNDSIVSSESLESDKFAQTCFVFKQGIPVISTFALPFGPYAKRVMSLAGIGQGPWILKPREMGGGCGVLKVDTEQQLRAAIDIIAQTGNAYILQPLVQNSADLRVYIADGEIFSTMKRVQKSGGYLSNLSAGGKKDVVDIDGETARLNLNMGAKLEAKYLCIDWLLTDAGRVFNEWCTVHGGFGYQDAADKFLSWIDRQIKQT